MRTRPSALVVALSWAWIIRAPPALAADKQQACEGHSYTVPNDFNLVCSASWRFTGRCTGRDLWDAWTVDGRTSPSPPFVRPWLDVPIEIVGYELVKLAAESWWPHQNYLNRTRSWFMVGSTIQPDAIAWLGPGETRAYHAWPAGYGQLWPAEDQAQPLKPVMDVSGKPMAYGGDLVDLHGQCYGETEIRIFLTIYYSPRPN
jgi:hypothetical protein